MEGTKLKLVFRHELRCLMLGHRLQATSQTHEVERTFTFGSTGGKEFITHSLYC